MKLFPRKLRPGDQVRIIAPSCSFLTLKKRTRQRAKAVLEALGLRVSFAKHLEEINSFDSSSVKSRLSDLHDAFADPDVRMVLCARGGFNSNELFTGIDYNLVRANPKILCGFSDITALAHALYVRAGLVTYSGPNFGSLGEECDLEYTIDSLQSCLFSNEPFTLKASRQWFDYARSGKRKGKFVAHRGEGLVTIHPGRAEGTLLGANACTMNLLQGTDCFPDLRGCVLFLEDDYESQGHHFNCHLQSLLLQPSFAGVLGMVIGRFESASRMPIDLLRQSIAQYPQLRRMPIIGNADFGHTQPKITFPIGGTVTMDAARKEITIVRH